MKTYRLAFDGFNDPALYFGKRIAMEAAQKYANELHQSVLVQKMIVYLDLPAKWRTVARVNEAIKS